MISDSSDNRTSIFLVEEKDISKALDKLIRDGLAACSPRDAQYFSRQSWWHTRPLWRVLVQNSSDKVIGHIAVVHRRVLVGSKAEPVTVAGIQSVFVRPDQRGEGISDRMMELAMSEAGDREIDVGLLFCVGKYESVYSRMGWTTIDARVFMRDSDNHIKPIPGKNITMIHCLNADVFPSGDVDLAGADW